MFRERWENALNLNAEDFGEHAFEELSWHTIGYRLNLLFGNTSPELQKEL